MLNSPRIFKDKCTHWIATPDGNGGFTYSAGALLSCVWIDKAEVHLNPRGEEFVSKSIVLIMSTDISVGDYLANGDQTAVADPTTLGNGSFRVQQFLRTPDLRNLETIRKAIL